MDAKPTDVSLQEALLINRAACNLELSQSLSLLAEVPELNIERQRTTGPS